MLTPEQENEEHNKPCPYRPSVMCVQYPDEDEVCDCDPCDMCPNKPKPKPKRIAIVGSRQRNTAADLTEVLDTFMSIYVKGDTIVSGGCPKGGDRFAEVIAGELAIPIKLYRPDWSIGRHAGFVRNTDIAMHSDVLIACVTKYRAGGTEDTIKKFRRLHPDGEIHLVI